MNSADTQYVSLGGRLNTDDLVRRTVTTMPRCAFAATERPPCLLTGRITLDREMIKAWVKAWVKAVQNVY